MVRGTVLSLIAIVDRLGYTLTLHRYPLKNVKGFIHDLLEDGRGAIQD
jgi:hypothetical protein